MARITKKAADTHRKHARALELKLSGMDYERITEELGYSNVNSAKKAAQAALKRITDPIAEDVLWMELGRLDRLMEAHWEMATDGDIKATETVLKIMQRRAHLLGLDTLNIDLTTKGGKIGGPMIYIPQMDEVFPEHREYDGDE
jgi:uncharacterized protein (DUF2164 family)